MIELLITMMAVLVVCVFLFIRIDRVLNFRIDIIYKSFDFPIDENFKKNMAFAERIIDKHSYDKMVFSFKPLKLECWFDEDEIRFLTEIHE